MQSQEEGGMAVRWLGGGRERGQNVRPSFGRFENTHGQLSGTAGVTDDLMQGDVRDCWIDQKLREAAAMALSLLVLRLRHYCILVLRHCWLGCCSEENSKSNNRYLQKCRDSVESLLDGETLFDLFFRKDPGDGRMKLFDRRLVTSHVSTETWL